MADVLSPSTADWDRGPKRGAYRRAGLSELWIVDPRAETIEVHDLPIEGIRTFAGAERAVSAALAGFSVGPAQLFG